ncbi:MAG: hypothetical protein JW942_00005, partial [Opitutales bacterium]|nr:hypothetical protein [Opitutales bacterium]
MDQPSPELVRQTYRWDITRGALFGVLDMIIQSFAILVAIRVFDTPYTIKPYIPAAYFLGYMVTPMVVWTARRTGCRMSVCVAICYLLGGSLLGAGAASADRDSFLLFTVLALGVYAQIAPLMTGVYTSNYSSSDRGQRLSTNLVITGIVGSACAWAAGRIMDVNVDYWRLVFAAGAVASILSAYAMIRIPTSGHVQHCPFMPFGRISLMWRDKVFGLMLLGWMFIGFGNLMILPLRVEYVANPAYGIVASNEMVALLTVTLPRVFSLLSAKFWGWAFDRWNLITIRLVVNAFIIGSILFYFFFKNPLCLAASSAMLGMSIGGAG